MTAIVRDDQPRADTCMQIALALRDEVADLEAAGIGMIQVDEPAIREGLPLRRIDYATYLRWSVDSIETSRSKMERLGSFGTFRYPNEVGPGVYDIHAPRVPTIDEMSDLLARAGRVLPVERLRVNPDCGLKTAPGPRSGPPWRTWSRRPGAPDRERGRADRAHVDRLHRRGRRGR